MGYVMNMVNFPSHSLCHSSFVSLSLAPSHVTPLWGGRSHSWLHPPTQQRVPNVALYSGSSEFHPPLPLSFIRTVFAFTLGVFSSVFCLFLFMRSTRRSWNSFFAISSNSQSEKYTRLSRILSSNTFFKSVC